MLPIYNDRLVLSYDKTIIFLKHTKSKTYLDIKDKTFTTTISPCLKDINRSFIKR